MFGIIQKRQFIIVNNKYPKNIEGLSIYLNEEWGKLDRNFLQNLVNSMPRRVAAVINSKGNPTKY